MKTKINPKGLKASDIRAGMRKKWCAPEYAIMWEVGQGTGQNTGRYADAVMMSLWPSRGLELHGVEIKITRADWKREAADPTKAEAIARYCDRWYIHTPPGVVDDLADMPPAWGLREYDGRAWRTLKEAEKTEAEPVTRPFLAAMLRRADNLMQSMIQEGLREMREQTYAESEKRRQQFNEAVERAAKDRTRSLDHMADKIAMFEESFGEDLLKGWSGELKGLGHAARALARCRITEHYTSNLVGNLRAAADAIEATQEIFNA